MAFVNMTNWDFEFRHDTPLDRALGRARPPEVFAFASAIDLANYLSSTMIDDYGRLQGAISRRLDADEDVLAIRKVRGLLGNLYHFRRYRGLKFERYHSAARADAINCATNLQKRQVAGLDREIASSRVVLQPGQVLFHGRCDTDLVTQQPYPTYVSTTLNPVVACNNAFRRAGINNINGRPLVFVLTLCVQLPALWGQVGRSVEWELLLPRMVTWRQVGRSSGSNFDVGEAEAL